VLKKNKTMGAQVGEKRMIVIPKGGVGPRNQLFLYFSGKADPSLRSG
jgi:hypothetical protein